jgi:hypothetical protein
MTDTTPPTAPESLPNYLADGLPKQDDSTLQDIQEYAQALMDHRGQSVDSADLPEGAEPVSESDGKGAVVLEEVQCGDHTCHCVESDGELHGPYLYRYLYDGGSLTSKYIGKPEDHPEIEIS